MDILGRPSQAGAGLADPAPDRSFSLGDLTGETGSRKRRRMA
jgi:hypothetical protein